MLGQGEDAKDAVQETFIKAYAHLDTLRDHSAFAGWLKAIMYNHCLMELQCRKKRMLTLSAYASDKDLLTDAECQLDQAPEEIKNTIAGLSEALQLACMLRFFSKNSSYQEIATILSIPVGTVRSRLAESRTKLASLIKFQDQSTKSNKAKEMEEFYKFHFCDAHYDHPSVTNGILNHFDNKVSISFTSGKTVVGWEHIKSQVEFDLKYGTRPMLAEVHSSGNISILELSNVNPPENPNLCPPSSTFIFVHPQNKTEKAFLHHAEPLEPIV